MGRFRKTNNQKSRAEVRKIRRNKGEAYVSQKGSVIREKTFKSVETCCRKNCKIFFDQAEQQCIFNQFWSLGEKSLQDTFLASCLRKENLKSLSLKRTKKRNYIWYYHLLSNDAQKRPVCQDFLLKVLSVTQNRLRTVQKKIICSKPFADFRGKNADKRKIPDEVWKLAHEHLTKIPHKNAHYCQKKTNLKYFDNPMLTVKLLHQSFLEFYQEEKKKPLKLAYKTYHKFFRGQCNFSFRRPRSDVCDFCSSSEVNLRSNPNHSCKTEYLLHKEKVLAYNRLKNELIASYENDPDTNILEFDYAQNLPLPKLNCCKQFYKRLLWFNVFNVHVHNLPEHTFMYGFMESEGKKGANSVISFVHKSLMDLMNRRPFKRVILFSDATGGQNKNFLLVQFCAWFAKFYGVEILHVYPVRGHNYSQCCSGISTPTILLY